MRQWILPFALLLHYAIVNAQEPPATHYVPPPTFERSFIEDQPVTQAFAVFLSSGNGATFYSTIEKLANSGDVVAQILLANSYTPPECSHLPFKTAPADCPTDIPSPNPMGLTRSFDSAKYWLTQASNQGNGEATEMLAELTERIIRASGAPGSQFGDVAQLHSLARSQGFNLQNVEYSCYILEPGHNLDSLTMAAGTPPGSDISAEQLILLRKSGATGTIQWKITSRLDLLHPHPEGPKVHIQVILSPAITRETSIPLPNHADVLYFQQANQIMTLPLTYPTMMRTIAFRPPTNGKPGGAFYQTINGSFEDICGSPSLPGPPTPQGHSSKD